MAGSSRSHVYLGIDVGTGSARAGVFEATGRMLATAACELHVWRPQADFVEQSSEDIWRAVCSAVAQAVRGAAVEPARIRGIGFDATCSLVVLGAHDQPVTVSPSGSDEQNIIVWMDHRALEQAERINDTEHAVLKYVGGRISPEMETPKLLWLKENLPRTWQRAARLLDLPDFLVYRATGHDVRSLCSTVCKWTYLGQQGETAGGWDDSYFRLVGLGDLVDEGYRRIGTHVRPVGEAVGRGLTPAAARELGLEPGTAVGGLDHRRPCGRAGIVGCPGGEWTRNG